MIAATPAALEWYDVVGRLALAGALGSIVGLEREFAGQDAGFRTHLMLALGAALFGVVSVGGFDAFVTDEPTNVRVDVTRIASYVAAGVGFIGGGAILKHAGTVRGITTATSLWTAAAIGLAAGVGFWVGAAAATGVALVALAALRPLSSLVERRSYAPRSLVVVVRDQRVGAAVLGEVNDITATSVRSMQVGEGHDDAVEVVVEFWTRPDDTVLQGLIERLEERFGADVRSIS
ncbi:MAG: MgtC/SapB family protein, partial [Acidobacteriota bacterium]